MAVNTPLGWNDPNFKDPWDVQKPTYDYTFQGHPIAAQLTTTSIELALMDHQMMLEHQDEIKRRLLSMLVSEMFKTKFIEFTKTTNASTMDVMYRARAFLLPDEKVRILRSMNKI